MGLVSRLKNIFEAKVEKGIDALEDPKEMLDYSLTKMEDSLQSMARNAVELGTAKIRVELERNTALETARKYEEQAEKALELGQEDLAKEALLRKVDAESRALELAAHIEKMAEQLQTISKRQDELRNKIRTFRSKKEELKATYAASKAQLKVKELVTTIGSESENIARTVERAEARIQEMQAKVLAVDELEEQGIISEVFADSKDDIERKLKRMSVDSQVELELARLKATKVSGGR
ncbi:PspA/IM30 family protein [Paradesulfitobacterium ferrireducens]|uniref:PspA/IM30 family protein n=1 Tax=Paradesulfitobacterium ferrireducens TaxID=2816476 RepID=UPI001A8ED8B5|nr:PspA/IM30 family protein [Paradesulfitobacterium ferrireducens]